MMRRILFIAPRFHTNQAHAVRALLRSRKDVVFLARRIRSKEDHDDLAPVVLGEGYISASLRGLADVKTHNKLFSYPPALRLIRTAREFQPDITVIREQGGYSSLSMLLMRALGFKCVLHTQRPICNPPDDEGRTPLTRVLQFISSPLMRYEITPLLGLTEAEGLQDRGLEAVSMETDGSREESGTTDASSGFEPYRVLIRGTRSRHRGRTVFHVPFVVEQPWPKEEWPEEGPVRILTVAEFRERKRVLELVEATAHLLAGGRDVRLTIIGNAGDERKVRYRDMVLERIESLGIEGATEVRMDLSHKETLMEYRHHDIFILPSDDEPAAYSPLEAMASGLPVICSKGNGTHEYIINAKGGLVFAERDFEGMLRYLESLVEDTGLRRGLGNNGKEFARARLRPDVHCQLLEGVHRVISADQ